MPAAQAKFGLFLRSAFACGSWLWLAVIADLTFRPTPPMESAVPRLAHDGAPAPAAENPEPSTVDAQPEQPDTPKAEPAPAQPSSGQQQLKSGDVATPPDARVSKPATQVAVAQAHEAPASSPDVAAVTGPQLPLTAELAQKVGQKVWLNESAGRRDAIMSWNAGEDFASLGIGHFIWFPAGKTAPFEESFPALIAFLRKTNTSVPAWLDKTPTPPCPWLNRADFKRKLNSPQTKQLRQFLLDTVAQQTQFLVARAAGATDKILETTPDRAEREHIVTQFSRVVQASGDRYPLIDYINFKGEGSNPVETTVDRQSGARQGWGLKQVLLRMNGTSNNPRVVLAEFADAAQFVLARRVRNNPASRIWEAGWLHRVDTYRRPVLDLGMNHGRVRDQRPRARSRAMNVAG